MKAAWRFQAVGGLFLVSVLALAHHSTASYDLVHGTIIDGVVTKFEWEKVKELFIAEYIG